jgi:hypothetical protein
MHNALKTLIMACLVAFPVASHAALPDTVTDPVLRGVLEYIDSKVDFSLIQSTIVVSAVNSATTARVACPPDYSIVSGGCATSLATAYLNWSIGTTETTNGITLGTIANGVLAYSWTCSYNTTSTITAQAICKKTK